MADLLSTLIGAGTAIGASVIGVVGTTRNQANRLATIEKWREEVSQKVANLEAKASTLAEHLARLTADRGLSTESARALAREEIDRAMVPVRAEIETAKSEIRALRSAAERGTENHHRVELALERAMARLETIA